MSEFEFQRLVTLGQVVPTGSLVHRLDPRTRLVGSLLIAIAIAAAPRLTGLGLALVALMLLLRLSRIPLRYALRGLLPPLPFLALLAILQLLFGPPLEAGHTFLHAGPIHISALSLTNAARLILRFSALILAITWSSMTISTTEMVRGLSSLFRPLTYIGFPTHDLVLVIQIALHFMPVLAREAERIAKAQASRGADWGTRRGNLVRRTKQIIPLLVPLFLISLRKAENLALAMEARGYQGGQHRTSMVVLRFRAVDLPAALISLLLALGIAIA